MALQKIGDWLKTHMPDLVKQSGQVATIQMSLQKLLPEHLQKVCKAAGFQRGILLLNLTNSLFATELRFAIPELISRFRTTGGLPQLIDIHIKVVPEQAEPPKPIAIQPLARPETETIRRILLALK